MSNANDRREFLKKSGLGLAGALIGARFFSLSSTAHAQKPATGAAGAAGAASAPTAKGTPLVMIKESDPQAKVFGYYEDATKVDTKKYPKRAGADGAKQFCYNCLQYDYPPAEAKKSAAAPCKALSMKGVKSHGWCNVWALNQAVKG